MNSTSDPRSAPIAMRVGTAWLHRFDVFTAKGVPPRTVMEEMAAEMDRLFEVAVRLTTMAPPPPMMVALDRCLHCGKTIP